MKEQLRNIKTSLVKLNIDNVHSKFFVLFFAGLGFIRGADWIRTENEHLKSVSDIYIKMSEVMDINTLGWLLVLFSVLLFLSLFFDESVESWFCVVGGFVCGTIYLLYGMISVDNSDLAATYYIGFLTAVMDYVIFITGVVNLWKIKN